MTEALTREHLCFVCGYDLTHKPWVGKRASHEVCHCCGFHYGYDDHHLGGAMYDSRLQAYRDRRSSWIAAGMPWRTPWQPPDDWDPVEQALRIFDLNLDEIVQTAWRASAPEQRVAVVPRRMHSYVRVRAHHLRPSLAWLRQEDAWYLVEDASGRGLHDDDLVEAIEIIGHAERTFDPTTITAATCHLLVRKITFPMEWPVMLVECDLLVDAACADETVAALHAAAQEVLAHAPSWLVRTAYTIVIHRHVVANDAGAEEPSLFGDAWFTRFMPHDFPWTNLE